MFLFRFSTSHIMKWFLKFLIYWIIHHLVIMLIWAPQKGIYTNFLMQEGRRVHTHALHTVRNYREVRNSIVKWKVTGPKKPGKQVMQQHLPRVPFPLPEQCLPLPWIGSGMFSCGDHPWPPLPCFQRMAWGACHPGFPCLRSTLLLFFLNK